MFLKYCYNLYLVCFKLLLVDKCKFLWWNLNEDNIIFLLVGVIYIKD